ncbi:TPA: hypothetical protein ACH3X3_013821 [Trebouxia sp. C0006]
MPTAGSLQKIAREHTKIHAKGKGGNTKFTCNHCNKGFTGSQTRQLAHLTGTSGSGVAACQEIDDDLRNAINIEVDRLGRVKSGSKASNAEQRPTKLLGLQDDEQFVPAFEMEDAADSDHAEESD